MELLNLGEYEKYLELKEEKRVKEVYLKEVARGLKKKETWGKWKEHTKNWIK